MMLNVCFLTGEYPPMQGGIADHTSHLARHLADLGVRVSVLTSLKAEAKVEAKVEVEAMRPGWPNPQIYPMISGWGLGCWRQTGRWLEEHQPDVLHIQYQAAAFELKGWVNYLPWWLRKRETPARVVVTFHDLRVPYLFPKAGPLRWRAMVALARYSNAAIVTNLEDEQRLAGALEIGRSGNRDAHESLMPGVLSRIPLGGNVDPQPRLDYDRGRWRAGIGVGSHTLVLAYFGFLNQSKGGEDLVLALEQLVRRGYDAHLLMIGGQVGDVDPTNLAYAERVRSLIQTCGLVDRVHWTGYTPPEVVSANLLAADVVVMPYRDGVSFRRTTFIAALGHGRPVVTTDPAVPLDELQDEQNVLLVPPCDVESLTGAVARLADDATLRERLSAGARALGARFDWSTISQQTLDLYRRLGLE